MLGLATCRFFPNKGGFGEVSIPHLGEDSATWVYKVDIREFLCGVMLNISILQVFMSALYEDLLGCDSVSKVGWLCPQEIRDANCLHNHAEANEYIERSIRQCVRSGDKYIIAPYIEDVMKKLRGSGPRRATLTQWKSVKCAQQHDGVACGYYVMRFMYDIISSCTEFDDLEKIYNTPKEESFTIEEINEVRDKFASFLTDSCL
ncbi:uncharacterized protein LOC104889435 [Beta vulgaris subsp. vulgaris]|uniref:uncharacterized protein LOC104889435 n=1 Tax=Beta vulgaris subsp. vulgaris TaxID=3555 RepID=UPI0025478F05|nr:uncharacterized protein LOC104889435 [Beta vulgaris subsp. vulgaris]